MYPGMNVFVAAALCYRIRITATNPTLFRLHALAIGVLWRKIISLSHHQSESAHNMMCIRLRPGVPALVLTKVDALIKSGRYICALSRRSLRVPGLLALLIGTYKRRLTQTANRCRWSDSYVLLLTGSEDRASTTHFSVPRL